ncbi:MAG: hypothetical protein ACO1SV_04315 [Fimbriimonas sp.]
MLGIAVAMVVAQAQPLVVEPWATFDGKTWAGVALGTSESDLKRQFKTGKTEIADPASVRIQSDRREWVISAILSATGGKGEVVGVAFEREKENLTSLDSLKKELGEPDGERFPEVRYGDWSVAYWNAKGIVATVDRGMVRKLLIASPEAIASRVEGWPTSQARNREEALVEVGDIDVRPQIKMKDGTAETLIGFQIQRVADRAFKDYDRKGWMPVRGGRNEIVINFKVDRKGDKEYRIEANGTLNAKTPLGEGYWTATQSSTERDAASVGYRVETIIERILRDLGDRAHEGTRRMVWQAEWRPFYGLARK